MQPCQQKSILCVVGTRPEGIKMAPVIRGFEQAGWADCQVLATGQHRELLEPIFEFFAIHPEHDLHVMRHGQSLDNLLGRLLAGLQARLAVRRPRLVLAQGDTTTVLAAALAAFSERIPFGHVEAGLRTHDLAGPYPEEANRVLVSRLAQLHFAPTMGARENLLDEGIAEEAIWMVGNTVIDALEWAAQRSVPIGVPLAADKRLLLVSAHRRESFGAALAHICQAVQDLVHRHDDIEVLWPLHPNPSVGPCVRRLLGGQSRIHLCPPLGYGSFVSALQRAYLILTDSGGIQEEAPALGKPVLVMRATSERPEAVAAGAARLVGTDRQQIVERASELLREPEQYRAMMRGGSPFGDGHAAERIVKAVGQYLGVAEGDAGPSFHSAMAWNQSSSGRTIADAAA